MLEIFFLDINGINRKLQIAKSSLIPALVLSLNQYTSNCELVKLHSILFGLIANGGTDHQVMNIFKNILHATLILFLCFLLTGIV